jgi:uncharacterized membrane protein YsdA (DUF1294 family)
VGRRDLTPTRGVARRTAPQPRTRPAPSRRPIKPIRPPWDAASCIALPAFAVIGLGTALAWPVSPWWVAVYLVASAVCFVACAVDKAAAIAGRWRLSERLLLALGLACGWPGAVVAQQLLRHKSAKRSFRRAFWASVLLNVGLFVGLHALGAALDK